ncbi:hypothetical protein Tco_1563353 [Tanacetum coccineum]
MTVHVNLPEQIRNAQTEAMKKENVKAENLGRLIKPIFKIRSDGIRYFDKRIWLPLYGGLRDLIMHESHKCKCEIATYVSKCLTCAKIIDRVGHVAYKLELLDELRRIHDTFHVSNLKKCLADENLVFLLEEIQLDDKLHFIEEPVEIMDREVKQLKQSRIPIVKVRWNSRREPELTWKCEDHFESKYTHLFSCKRKASKAKRAPRRRSFKMRRM